MMARSPSSVARAIGAEGHHRCYRGKGGDSAVLTARGMVGGADGRKKEGKRAVLLDKTGKNYS